MSWQSHVDSLLASGKVKHAAIHGHNGHAWATSPGFTVQAEEAQRILRAIDSKDYMTIMQKEGVVMAGEHYMFMRHDPGLSVTGKKGLGGCYVSKTGKTVIFAVFEAPASLADCVCDVEKLADYYISMQM